MLRRRVISDVAPLVAFRRPELSPARRRLATRDVFAVDTSTSVLGSRYA
jgi:hypothetical protein